MRNLFIALLMALPITALAAPAETVVLEVSKMTCSVCPITVKKALEKVAGVEQVEIDFDNKTATVSYDPDKAQTDALTAATTNAGYPSVVKPQENQVQPESKPHE